MTASQKTRCSKHGIRPWFGTICCHGDGKGCGLVFQTLFPHSPLVAPDICPCGLRLRPVGDDLDVSSRVMCTQCFEGFAASGKRAKPKAVAS